MTNPKTIIEFIHDFDNLPFSEVCNRWQYKELPSADDLLSILKGETLKKYIDQGPDSRSFPYFLIQTENGYEFFHWFRNMKVNEMFFDNLEDAVKEKFIYALDAIWGMNR